MSTSKPTIAITGSTGLLGSRIIELLSDRFDFLPLRMEDGIDITDKQALSLQLAAYSFDFLLHLAAYTNVDKAEAERELCRQINVDGTRNLFEICQEKKARMIHISTDFVFDGKLLTSSFLGEGPRRIAGRGEGVRHPIHVYNRNLLPLATQKRKSMTLYETKIWTILQKNQIGYDFHRQKVISDFIVDFYCPELQLILEIDGKYHEYTEKTDLERQQYLESLGITVIRIPNENVIDGIGAWLKKKCQDLATGRTPSVATDATASPRKHGAHSLPIYTEVSLPHPLGYYAQTKYEAEQIVKDEAMIVRLTTPYRKEFEGKKDVVRTIKSLLEEGKTLMMIEDNLIVPTHIDDISHALGYLIDHYHPEIYHAVGTTAHSSYEVAMMIARHWHLDESLITPTTHAAYQQDKAPRPQYGNIISTKDLGVQMKGFEEGLQLL